MRRERMRVWIRLPQAIDGGPRLTRPQSARGNTRINNRMGKRAA